MAKGMSEFYRGRLVAVTGGTGLNGSYIVKALAEAGAKVRAISRIRPPNEFTKLASEIVSADLMDTAQTAKALRGAEVVMHAAGVAGEPYPLYAGLAWVKRFSEKLCKFYQDNSGLKVAIIRPSGAYGRFDNFDENTSHVLPAIIKRALSGAKL